MGRMRQDHLCGIPASKITANKGAQRSPSRPKTALASCLAMTLSAYYGTPAQPQPKAMGAARRDPRRGEIPGARRQLRFSFAAHGSGSSVE